MLEKWNTLEHPDFLLSFHFFVVAIQIIGIVKRRINFNGLRGYEDIKEKSF